MRAGVRAAHPVLVRPRMSEEGLPEGISALRAERGAGRKVS